MKKILAIVLVVIMMVAVVACGGNTASQSGKGNGNSSKSQVTASQLQSVVDEIETSAFMSSWKGSLNISKTDGNNVTEFSYVITGMSVSGINESAIKEGLRLLSRNDLSLLDSITYCQAVDLALAMEELVTFLDNSGGLSVSQTESMVIAIICNGTTKEYNGWSVNAEISESTNTITVFAKCQ